MLVILLLSVVLVLIDQVSKYFVLSEMFLGESIVIIENFFSLTSHRNRGAAWGILQDSRLFFIVVTSILLVGIFVYLLKNVETFNVFDKIIASLIVGGAVGNFIDRFRNGEVVDFFDFKILGYDFPIFNFADIFIVVGVFFLLVKIYREDN